MKLRTKKLKFEVNVITSKQKAWETIARMMDRCRLARFHFLRPVETRGEHEIYVPAPWWCHGQAEISMDGVVNSPEMFAEIFKYHTGAVLLSDEQLANKASHILNINKRQ